MKIIIVGPRSIGKTTIGKSLAKRLRIKYLDFDEIVGKKLKSIDNHIKNYGIESYRKHENKILKKVILELPKKCIMSIGGGTITSQFSKLNNRNIKYIRKEGMIIYLSPSENYKEAIKILNKYEQKRRGGKNIEETTKLFMIRKPIYDKIFDIKITTKQKSNKKIINEIIKKLK